MSASDRILRILARLLHWKSFVLLAVVAVLGPDLWQWHKDRSENFRLRAAACERMVELEFLRPELQRLCRENAAVYRDGIMAAVHSQTARMQAKIEGEVAQLDRITDGIDGSEFSPLSLEDFWEKYDPFPFNRDGKDDPDELDHVRIEAPWLIITGYGNIRVEMPATASSKLGKTAVQLAIDEPLQELLIGALSQICRRTSSIATGCSGELFVVARDCDCLDRPKAVGLRLAPITMQQIDMTGMDMLDPPFADGSLPAQSAYMKRFLDLFTVEFMQKKRLVGRRNAKPLP